MSGSAHSVHIARLNVLRACAVSVVVLFHLKPEALPWGYIGVDMFFSLSGFLMTWLFLCARAEGRSFPAGRFIARRFWRIFPPLAVTVLCSLSVAMVLFAPGHLLNAGWSSIAALFSVSNLLFFSEAGYFDTDAIFKPLLHTWSLGVEEQFYAVFALALLCVRFVPLWIFLAFVAVVSCGLWSWVVLGNSGFELAFLHDEPFSALFFLPQYRAFQFAVGGLAAYAVNRTGRFGALVSWGGALLMCAAIWLAANKELAHLSAFIITFGCVGLMVRAPFLDRISHVSPVPYLARISYQLYLVHWPVIVFWSYVTLRPLSWGEAGVCALVCLGLSDVLYRLTNSMRAR